METQMLTSSILLSDFELSKALLHEKSQISGDDPVEVLLDPTTS